jgi:hypothetical protein
VRSTLNVSSSAPSGLNAIPFTSASCARQDRAGARERASSQRTNPSAPAATSHWLSGLNLKPNATGPVVFARHSRDAVSKTWMVPLAPEAAQRVSSGEKATP